VNTVTRTILTAGAVLMTVSAAVAQRPESVRPAVLINTTPPSPAAAARSPLAVIERLLSFDTNKDHRITRDELPDRMQALIARIDKNADAALDSDEIRAAVTTASSDRSRVAFRVQPSDGLAGVINDLKLSPAKREQAFAILSAHKQAPGVHEALGGDLYKAMRSLLDDEEYENFTAAAARLTKTMPIRMGSVGGIVRPLPPPPPDR
jgi:pimeloyl-ACP methyl ester carboxylesterase